jgi:hypothetical protein
MKLLSYSRLARGVAVAAMVGALGAPLALSSQANAQGYYHGGGWHGGGWHGGWGGPGPGVAVASGLLGLAVGAAVGSAIAAPPVYAAPPPVYYAPPPVVYAPPPPPPGYYAAPPPPAYYVP